MNQVAHHPTMRLKTLSAETFEGLTQKMEVHGVRPGSWRVTRSPVRVAGLWRCVIAVDGPRDPVEDQRLADRVLAKGDK